VKTGRLLSVLFFAFLPTAALADPSCFGLCSIDCVKPISIPDRWDDNSVPGAVGWSGNRQWDSEKFTDTNGNGVYDAGEPFQDGTSAFTRGGAGPLNGRYDAESYDPLNTGYVASKDLGLEITLKAGAPTGANVGSQYYPIVLPAPGGTAADRYRWSWANCNPFLVSIADRLVTETGSLEGPTGQALRDLISQDPGAYWDDGCQCVNSPMGEESPRVIVFAAHDPRIPLDNGSQSIIVSKLVGFFVEAATINGDVKGRFVRVQRAGDNSCTIGGDFIVDCAVAAKPTTWGGVKGIYR